MLNGKKIEYVTVEFESNEGSDVAPIIVEKSQKITKPAYPVKEGFTFGGLFADAELTQEFSFETAIAENVKLFAKRVEVLE